MSLWDDKNKIYKNMVININLLLVSSGTGESGNVDSALLSEE